MDGITLVRALYPPLNILTDKEIMRYVPPVLVASVIALTPSLAVPSLAHAETRALPPVSANLTTDLLGTHTGPALTSTAITPRGSNPQCGSWSEFGGGFNTGLGSGWTSLSVRTGPCTAAPTAGDSHGEGSVWKVNRETHGLFICRGKMSYNYGTDVWFKDSKGWSWSGGTSTDRWQYKKSC